MAFVTVAAPGRHEADATAQVEPDTGIAAKGAASSAGSHQPVSSRSRARITRGHIILAIIAFVSIFPVYWLFATAFRRPEDALSQSPIPWPLSVENFVYVWETIPMASMLGNTFVMASTLAAAQLLIAILAAYGFAMWKFRGRKLLFFLFVGSWLVPFQVTMIPNYLLVSQMGLLNTVAGVVIPQLCSAFAVLLLRQHMEAFPRELVDASHIDGRTSWGALWRVVIPNIRPALAALGIMLFITAWNEYLWPTLILQQSDAVVQIGVRSFLGQEGNNWGAVMAASGLACIPVLVIYLFLQRYVVDAFIRSGLK